MQIMFSLFTDALMEEAKKSNGKSEKLFSYQYKPKKYQIKLKGSRGLHCHETWIEIASLYCKMSELANGKFIAA
jgi:hypothetical protein